jgi:Arc/MetJ-type ribon-helix-helix transcriptional regulator
MAEAELTLELPEEELERLEWACKARGFHSLDECVQEAIRLLIAKHRHAIQNWGAVPTARKK